MYFKFEPIKNGLYLGIQSVENPDDFETIFAANEIEADNADPIFGGIIFSIRLANND